jgi:hypothetical protein
MRSNLMLNSSTKFLYFFRKYLCIFCREYSVASLSEAFDDPNLRVLHLEFVARRGMSQKGPIAHM